MSIEESYKNTSFAAIPERNVTYTINSALTGGVATTLEYDLNKVTM